MRNQSMSVSFFHLTEAGVYVLPSNKSEGIDLLILKFHNHPHYQGPNARSTWCKMIKWLPLQMCFVMPSCDDDSLLRCIVGR